MITFYRFRNRRFIATIETSRYKKVCKLRHPITIQKPLILPIQKGYSPVIQIVLRCHNLELSFLDKVFED